MKITTALLGDLEFEEKDIIHFPGGIPAFEKETKFLIIAMEEGGPFYYMQSVHNPDLCLVLAQPFIFFPNYTVEISDQELQKLESQGKREDLAIYVILTVPEDFKQSSANLMAPVIINQAHKKGLQFIATNSEYTTRHYLFPGEHSKIKQTAQGG